MSLVPKQLLTSAAAIKNKMIESNDIPANNNNNKTSICINCCGQVCQSDNSNRFEHSSSLTNPTFYVTKALSSIFKLDFLKPFDTWDYFQQEEEDAQLTLLCVNCFDVLANVYNLYQDFLQLGQVDSVLSKKLQKLDEVIDCHEQKRINCDLLTPEPHQVKSTIKDNPAATSSAVNLSTAHHQLCPKNVVISLTRLTDHEFTTTTTKSNNATAQQEDQEFNDFPHDQDSGDDGDYDVKMEDDGTRQIKMKALDDIIELEAAPRKSRRKQDLRSRTVAEPNGLEEWDKEVASADANDDDDDDCEYSSSRKKRKAHKPRRTIKKKPLEINVVKENPKELKTFTCSCGEIFNFKFLLKRHAVKLGHDAPEAGRDLTSCPICPEPKVHLKEHLLIKHMEMNHEGERIYKCSVTKDCQKSFWKRTELKKHVFKKHRIQEIYECTECGLTFPHLKKFRKHMQSHRSSELQKELQNIRKVAEWPCPHCPALQVTVEGESEEVTTGDGVVFKTKKELMDHCSVDHPGQRLQKCGYPGCDRTFWDKFELGKHFLSSHEADDSKFPFKCTFDSCSKKFVHQFQLTVHLRSHSGDLPFLCPKCGRRFKSISVCNQHVRAHQARFLCPSCPKIFNNKFNLGRHEQEQHLGLKEFLCTMCAKTFFQKASLDNHMFTMHQVGESKYECGECGKKFSSKSMYTQHLAQFTGPHTTVPPVRNRRRPPRMDQSGPFPCTVEGCEKIFPTSAGLQIHLKKSHLTNPLVPTSCPECGKVFLGDSRLRIHITTIHRKNMGTFPCSLCGKALANQGNLKLHMKYHQKYPPGSVYKCDVCDQEFTQQRFLTRHVNFVHKVDKNSVH